jgi:glycerol-3-phosphate acyltransferase PlsY
VGGVAIRVRAGVLVVTQIAISLAIAAVQCVVISQSSLASVDVAVKSSPFLPSYVPGLCLMAQFEVWCIGLNIKTIYAWEMPWLNP